ncbi:DUF2326 domain-containing protein [Marinomonas rhizomae]|uniref:DUF2326 domain-containing protein n=1 Tax=Marinomonas rhizomae TaxID=491948 RepID=UPI002103F727|nr:DUF2326 domain-containing protein [Marinomonas rhizomae]UTW01248.1 DUF2326 domain-containing protein [Marinomonas rhizomae]
MLKSISCEELIKTPIVFKKGFNSVVGADDAHNSIGKSSILMLIDFAFGGSDFPNKCDDVIRNVGHFKIGIEFEFDKVYSFIRDTDNLDQIYRVEFQDYITNKQYNTFLKDKYLHDLGDASFRECVSGFFRIYQRDNYNDNRPLDIVRKESWEAIRKRQLKIFGKFKIIEELEDKKTKAVNEKKSIEGTFRSGAVKKLNKTELKKNFLKLDDFSREIEQIKTSLKSNVTDIKSIINERNLLLKLEKDRLVELKNDFNLTLQRLESNLSDNIVRNSDSFNSVIEFFPEISKEKLSQVEGFHNGITKILKNQLLEEKKRVIASKNLCDSEIKGIDEEILKVAGSKEETAVLLERLMELGNFDKELKLQNDFKMKLDDANEDLKNIKNDIHHMISSSIESIENIINEGMARFIKRIYLNNPIEPKISFGKTDYIFHRGDDRGTGKGYSNMICLDLTYLENTILPCLIHDSILFKNMDVPALERLISIYSESEKQIFIAIDEKAKYSIGTQIKIHESMFLKLDGDKVAFKIKWNKESN